MDSDSPTTRSSAPSATAASSRHTAPAPFAELIERAHEQARENHFDAVVVTDMEGRIVDWNRASERLYGYRRDEVIGQPVDMLHVPEDREHLLHAVLSGVERDGRWEGQVRLLRKDGSRGWIESAVVPVLNAAGNAVGALGINRDITARVVAERELAEAEARFRKLVEHSLVGIYTIRDARFLYVNPMFEEIFGYSAAEAEQMSALDLVTAEDRARVEDHMRRRLEGEPLEHRYSFHGVRKDGRVIEVEVHGTRIEMDGMPAIIGMVQDVTARREAERRLRESEQRHRAIVDEMFDRVATVLASREKVRQRLLDGEAPETADAPRHAGAAQTPGADERFLARVRAVILEHLGEESFTVERLAAEVAQSRSQLHRRLRQLADETPSSLIREMRLARAAELLERPGATVAEVAFAVGFKSVSHFSNSFADHFGERPSTYRERARKRG